MAKTFTVRRPYAFIQPAAVSYDSAATTYFNAVTTAGGTLSTTEKDAWNSAVASLKADGTWTQIKGIYPFMGGTSGSAGINAKSPGTYNMSFPNGLSVGSYGIRLASSSSQYGDVGATPYAIIANGVGETNWGQNGHLAFIVSNDSTYQGGAWGAYHNSVASWRLQLSYNGHFFSDNQGESSSGARLIDFSSTYTLGTGFFMGNRLNQANHRLIHNTTLITSSTASIGGTSAYYTGDFNLCLNSRGGASEVKSGWYKVASMGLGLTTTQEGTLYTSMNTFRNALSR